MAHIRSKKHSKTQQRFTKSLLTLAIAAPMVGHAQTNEAEKVLRPVNVKGAIEVPYKVEASSNPKYTQPLVDTPQTIQVIKKEVLREQGAVSLMEALRNTPGITMQLGENGNTSAGDTFQMRGFSTQTSTFVDGIRDLGPVTRDVYNLEQIEVVKGPAGADIGRGSASGYINLISKLPTLDGENYATASYGTADKKRATIDLNQGFSETGAVRLNALWNDGEVDERDVVENTGFAIAPSLALGLGTDTRFYVYGQIVRQNNIPDGGIPAVGFNGYFQSNTFTGITPGQQANANALAAQIMAADKVDRENFYGSKKDYEDVNADMITLKLDHDFNDKAHVTNITRYGKTEMNRVMSGIGSISVSATTIGGTVFLDPNSWALTPSRQRIDRDNEIFGNQTNLNLQFDTGALKHSLAGGTEILYERQKNLTFGTAAATINGVSYPAIVNPPTNMYNPDPDIVRGVPYPTGAYTDGDTTTAALYAFDTLELSEQWLLNGGLRYEHYRTNTDASTVTNNVTVGSRLDDADNLLSWKAGVIFKPLDNGSVYVSYANSETPPGSADFALSATANNQNNAALDPQETENYEIGTKWDLLDQRLSLTAAWFRTENSKQTSFDDLGNPLQIGKTRVEGVELAAVGQITNFWQITAGITTMDSDAIDQQNATGTETTGVRWTPDLSATLWSSYTWGDLTFGGGARYLSEQKRTITANTAPATGLSEIPDFVVVDAMIAYRINKNVNLRLNAYNLFDEEYIETLNNGGNRVRLGQPRSGTLTGEFTF